jgi:hypothetical protein
MEGPIPDSVARFLAAHVRSLEQLEILLLLAGQPSKEWSGDEVYDVIRSSQGSVRERLGELRNQGLLLANSHGTAFRFAPSSVEIAATVESLAQLYKERRVKIVEMIYAPPAEPLKGFADAFRFKKEK